MGGGAMDWDGARRTARGVEKKLRSTLQALRDGSRGDSGGVTRDSDRAGYDVESNTFNANAALLSETEGLIFRYKEVTEIMSSHATGEMVRRRQVQRSREVLAGFKSEFLRLQTAINNRQRDHELLRQVDNDAKEGGATDHLLRERRLLESGLQQAEALNAQADGARISLESQRSSFSGTADRLLSMATTALPGAASWIRRIQHRRSRQTVVLSAVIATLVLFSMWWFSGG